MHRFTVLALVAFAAPLLSAGSPVTAPDAANDVQTRVVREDELMRKLNAKCSAEDVSSCVMLKLVACMNKLMRKNTVEIGDTFEIAKRDGDGLPAEDEARLPAAAVAEPAAGRGASPPDESAAFGQIMAEKVCRYVRTRSLKIRVLPEADLVVSASPAQDGSLDFGVSFRSGKRLESGRGKNKNMGPMMAAMMMKMGMLKVMAFKVLALLVGKALFVSKLAFLLAVLIGLKKLFSQQKHVTYEVVAHPHHEPHGGDSYGSAGWGRSSSEAAHSMAYSGQAAP